MKTLKSMLAGMALLFICFAANAAVKPAADKLTQDEVVKVYTDAVAYGKMSILNDVLDDNMKFNTERGENVNTVDKDTFVSNLKSNPSTDASVTVISTIVQGDDQSAIMKVEFKYADYVRTDMVTLTNLGNWKITDVRSSFK